VCQPISYLRQEDVKLDSKAYIKTMALTSQFSFPKLLQLRGLRLGSDEDGDIRVGVFPECEEILICLASLVCVALQRIRDRHRVESTTHLSCLSSLFAEAEGRISCGRPKNTYSSRDSD
jgi:hypothetical protein